MNTYFTADLHLGHQKIIPICNRPFANVDEMDEELTKRWNSVVSKKDIVYVLGDFAMFKKEPNVDSMKKYRRAFQRLNGSRYLVLGNHDHMSREVYRECFKEVYDGIVDKIIDHQKVTLCHYPMMSWNCSCHGSWLFHGHAHGRVPEIDNRLSIDVGVDIPKWNYSPVSWDTLKVIFRQKYNIWCEYWNKSQYKSV